MDQYFLENPVRLIKLIRGKKQVCRPIDAVDEHYVFAKDIYRDEFGKEHLPNFLRARPYLGRPYLEYFCDGWIKNQLDDPFNHEDCKICKPFDEYWHGHDIGFLTGWINGIVVIDNDTGMTDNEFKSFMRKNVGDFPETWTARTGSGGTHYYFSHRGPFSSNLGRFLHKVDFLGDNRWSMLPPCKSKKGSYAWIRAPSRHKISRLPAWAMAISQNNIKLQRKASSQVVKNLITQDETTLDHVLKALNEMRIENFSGDQWYAIGYALCSNGFEKEFRDWCQTDTRKQMYLSSAQLSHFRSNSAGIGIGNFFRIMLDKGWKFKAKGKTF